MKVSPDEDQRTNTVGLYHYARSYRVAAEHLKEAGLATTHAHAPVDFLFFHAIELYLKSYLRLHGFGVRQLKAIGHRACCLSSEARVRGMRLDDEDTEVVFAMSATDVVMQSRYIKTGAFNRPSPEMLSRTALSFHHSVFSALRAAGKLVRY